MQRQLDYFWRTIPSKEKRYQRDLHTVAYWGADDSTASETYTRVSNPLYMSSPGGSWTQDGPYRILFRHLQLSLNVDFSKAQPDCSPLPYWGYYRFSIFKAEKKAPASVITNIWIYSNAIGTGVDIDPPALDLPWIDVGADEYLYFQIELYRQPLTAPDGWRSKWLVSAWMDTYTQY
uniref:Uncharacterized protein n=1 Tax=unidentified TaxID=32644 RepID=A0A6G9W397_9ZZZZ|nr:hypothetical protein [unidentified]